MSYVRTRSRGFGAVNPVQGAISATGTAAGSTAALLIGGAAGGPIGLAIAGVITALAPLITGVIEGCGESCEVTTQWANQAESALQQNIAAYFSLPAPRSTVDQAAALANFTAIWNALVDNCNNAALGDPGQRCITDRQNGACTWKQTTTPPWGSPVQGACWNWWNGYHDPIANDPAVPPTAASASSTGSAATGGAVSSSYALPLLIAAAVVVALVVSR